MPSFARLLGKDREDDAPPPYEEIDSSRPQPGLSGQQNSGPPLPSSSPSPWLQIPQWQQGQPVNQGHGMPRPHSAHEPFPNFQSPSPSPQPPSSPVSPRPTHLSPYPGQAAHQQAQQAFQSRPHRHSNPAAPQMIPRQFPQIFNVYLQAFSRTMFLAEHQSQPIYALKAHSGLGADASLVLHSGPTEGYPPLATLDLEPFSRSMAVTLPPAPHPGAPVVVELQGLSDFPHASYVFIIEVGNSGPRARGGGWPLEQFEWRRSRGDSVASLGGRGYGWKLVRLAGGPPPGASMHGRVRYVTGGDRGSDGSEVVAAWTETGYSMSKAVRFGFFGTGASGLLGERWAIMAVMTGLGLFERDRRAERRRR